MTPHPSNVRGYFCRACGGPLPSGGHCLFHPLCLKVDKRRRVAEAREKERRKFEKWLSQQRCPECGAKLALQKFVTVAEPLGGD